MKTDTPETDKHRSVLRTVAESTAFEERLERDRDEARKLLAQYSQEREHNAMQALMWRKVAERLAKIVRNNLKCPVSLQEALADFEEAKK